MKACEIIVIVFSTLHPLQTTVQYSAVTSYYIPEVIMLVLLDCISVIRKALASLSAIPASSFSNIS